MPTINRAHGPFRAALMERIEAKGGMAPIYERIASGETLTKIAPEFGVSRQYLRDILAEGPERLDLFLSAQREAAHAFADQGMALLDEVDTASPTARENVAKAREQARYRQWMASKLDRETFGDTPLTVNVPLSFGDLHLQAIKAPLPAKLVPSGPPALPVLEADVVTEESA
jgi:hypothetical protein